MKLFIKESLRRLIKESENGSKLYHGSQKAIDEKGGFLTTYIKSGVGDNLFGWGLYFTSNIEIAKAYARNNTSNMINRYISLAQSDFNLTNIDAVIKHFKRSLPDMEMFDPEQFQDLSRFISFLIQKKKQGFNSTLDLVDNGYLYEVRLTPSKPNILDWYGTNQDGMTGGEYYKSLVKELGSDQKASLYLYDQGFYGIKYPSGTIVSHNLGDGMNYVIFNDKDITITKSVKL